MTNTNRGAMILLLCALVCSSLKAQTVEPNSAPIPDPLSQIVNGFSLANQTLPDGVGKLNQLTTNVGFSIEFPLGASISQPAPTLAKFTVNLRAAKVSDLLNKLCDADPVFTWKKNGSMINVFPQALENNEQYVLNRAIPLVSFNGIKNAQEAVFQVMNSWGSGKEQIAMLQTGSSDSFAEPWTATFHNTTVREMLNHIAQQLGPTYGWQLGGAADFRIVTFHSRILSNIERTQSFSGPTVPLSHD